MKSAMLIVVLLALVAGGTVSAQEQTPEPTPETYSPRVLEIVAERLDLSVEDLEAMLAEGLTLREIVREQMPAGGFGEGRPRGGFGFGEGPRGPMPGFGEGRPWGGFGQGSLDRAIIPVLVAEGLDMTVEELQTRLSEGATLRELAVEAGIDLPVSPVLEQAAEFLGITVEELQEMLDAGMTPREIAEELGVTLPPRGFFGRR